MLPLPLPPAGERPGPSQLLTVGQLASRSGVAASALRFYEARGLLQPSRNAAGYRVYPRADLRRVAFIVAAQRVGLSLEEIRGALATLPDGRVPTRADWAVLSAGWAPRIDARIAELERLRDGLLTCIGCGCLSLDRCALANPGDRAAEAGPGPRAWTGPPPDVGVSDGVPE